MSVGRRSERRRRHQTQQGRADRGTGEQAAAGETLADAALEDGGPGLGLFGIDVAAGALFLTDFDELIERLVAGSHGVGIQVL